jgi:hypothetical protein
MRADILVFVIGLLTVPLVANAQTPNTYNGRKLEDAPVPAIMPPGVSPADSVSRPGSGTIDAGPLNATPFSDTPSGVLSDGGTQTSKSDRTLSPADTSGVTPNLSR